MVLVKKRNADLWRNSKVRVRTISTWFLSLFFFLLLSSTLPNQCIYHLLNAHAAKKKKNDPSTFNQDRSTGIVKHSFRGFSFQVGFIRVPWALLVARQEQQQQQQKKYIVFLLLAFVFAFFFPFVPLFFFSFSSLLLLASLVHHERAFQLRDGFVRAAADRVFRHVPAAVSPHFIPPRQRRALQEVPLQVQRSR